MLATLGSIASQGGFPISNPLVYSKFEDNMTNLITGQNWTVNTAGNYKYNPSSFGSNFGKMLQFSRSGDLLQTNIMINLPPFNLGQEFTIQFFHKVLSTLQSLYDGFIKIRLASGVEPILELSANSLRRYNRDSDYDYIYNSISLNYTNASGKSTVVEVARNTNNAFIRLINQANSLNVYEGTKRVIQLPLNNPKLSNIDKVVIIAWYDNYMSFPAIDEFLLALSTTDPLIVPTVPYM